MTTNALDLTLFITLYWFFWGGVGALWLYRSIKGLRTLFLLSTLGSVALLIISACALFQPSSTIEIFLGIPNYPLHFYLDSLSAFFILLLSAASIGVGLFASYYFQHFDARTQSFICFNYHWFLASMIWVFLAADAYSFLLAWEFMALSSYFLILAVKPDPENLHAAFLYLLVAHLGAIALLAGFALIGQGADDFTFAAMRQAHLPLAYPTLAFIFIFIGFGAKAGILPLHVWLPEAHPAAPSPISALMSGVMLKTAVYGFIRLAFDVLDISEPSFGLVVLIFGTLTALLGVILAAMQTDMKRLLAYSSIENIGIIFAGIGLALVFHTSGEGLFAALTLAAVLLHCFNHAIFKSLLFLGTGSVLHATGHRNLGKLGGLIKRMPWVAGFVLVGTLAISGVPPLNGFASEWLLLQAFLLFPDIPSPFLTMFVPITAAVFALTIGLSAYVMVKFYGIIFLGKPRESQLSEAIDSPLLERWGLGWLALLCVVLGLFPWLLLHPITHVTSSLLGEPITSIFPESSWLFVIPLNAARASYSPWLFFLIISALVIIVYGLVYTFYYKKSRRSAAWDCGFPLQNSRMQDTAEGFGQPIKQIFSTFIQIKQEVPSPFDKAPHYHMQTTDRFWYALYLPILQITMSAAQWVTQLQRGRISHYLLYSFGTLLMLLWWAL